MARNAQEDSPGDIAAVKAWLRELRDQAGLTQAELGAAIGRDRRTVLNAEKEGEGLPHGLAMVLMLRELGVVAGPNLKRPPTVTDRLRELEEKVDAQGKATTTSVDALARDVRALTRRLGLRDGAATHMGSPG